MRYSLFTALVIGCWGLTAIAGAQGSLPAEAERITVTLDVLLDRLAGPDDQARALARQWIPRFGAEAVPGLIRLLERDEAAVWRSAFVCLRDIAHQPAPVTMNDRCAEPPRVALHRVLAEVIAANEHEALTRRALELVPLVWAEEDDPGPVAALLDRPEFREAAIRALHEAATPACLDALTRFAEDPAREPGARREAALALIGRPGRPDAVPSARRLLADSDPGVAAAGARLLAESGGPADWPALRAAAESLPPDLPEALWFEYWDACLRMADRAVRSGGQWEWAMARYREILAAAPDPVIAAGALMGMARFGDETEVPDLLAALERPDAEQLAAPVLSGLLALRGRSAARAIQDRWEQLPEDFRAALAERWGTDGGDFEAEWVMDLARNAERPVRRAAVMGLLKGCRPAAAEYLAAYLEAFSDEPFEPWELNARMYAAELFRGDENRKRAAVLAALQLARRSQDEETIAEAMRWIQAWPIPEALDVLIEQIQSGNLPGASASALAQLAAALIRRGDREEGIALAREALRTGTTPEQSGTILTALTDAGLPPELADQLGVIRGWQILGPLSWPIAEGFTGRFASEPAVDVSASVEGMNGRITWQTIHETGPLGEVNLAALQGMVEGAAAVAVCRISVAEPVKAVLRCGSDDGLKVWVNGRAVFENDCDRGMRPDQDLIPLELQAGENRLTLVITQRAGGWGFQARLTDEQGGPLSFSLMP